MSTHAKEGGISMIDLDPQRVIEMTPSDLGVVVIRDLVADENWSQ
jgi:hypothetical protein